MANALSNTQKETVNLGLGCCIGGTPGGNDLARHTPLVQKQRQRCEIRLISLPEIQGVAVNRLPDLFGASGAHRTIFIVVAEAGLLKIQLGMREQLAHLSVEILNDLFILDSK